MKSGYFEATSWEQTQNRAKCLNQTIVIPKNDELFIDIDNVDDYNFFLKQHALLASRGIVTTTYSVTSSKTAGHYHIVVYINRSNTGIAWTPEKKLLLQCLLGSDRKHEMWSYISHQLYGHPHPTVFFENKPYEIPFG